MTSSKGHVRGGATLLQCGCCALHRRRRPRARRWMRSCGAARRRCLRRGSRRTRSASRAAARASPCGAGPALARHPGRCPRAGGCSGVLQQHVRLVRSERTCAWAGSARCALLAQGVDAHMCVRVTRCVPAALSWPVKVCELLWRRHGVAKAAGLLRQLCAVRDPRTRRPAAPEDARAAGAAPPWRQPAPAAAAPAAAGAGGIAGTASLPIIDRRRPPPYRRRDADGRYGERPPVRPVPGPAARELLDPGRTAGGGACGLWQAVKT
jgi:hypothetical protein